MWAAAASDPAGPGCPRRPAPRFSNTFSGTAAPGDPVGAGERHSGHRRCLDGERDEVLGFEVLQVRLPAGPGDGLRLHGEYAQVVGEAAAALDGVEAGGELGVLRSDAGRVAPVLEIVVEPGSGAELRVLAGV